MRPPEHDLDRVDFVRPHEVLSWSAANLSAYRYARGQLFSPVDEHPSAEWERVIRASQFRSGCDRLLLVSDDMAKAGLGMTARMLMVALLWAVRTNRVLVEVPVANASLGAARWCDRPPHTMQCFVRPWSHCAPPAGLLPHAGRLMLGAAKSAAATVHVSLSTVHKSKGLWQSVRSAAYGAALRFLFRPRPWIQSLGHCVMHTAGLRPLNFISVHVRDSPEKRKEAASLRTHLPGISGYLAVARASCARRVHLQTASASALGEFRDFAEAESVGLAYTNNRRPEHDSWGGWSAGQVMEQGIVGMVNMHIGIQSRIFISPSISMWTMLLAALMSANSTVQVSLCCGCGGRGFLRIVAHPSVSPAEIDAFVRRTRGACRTVGRPTLVRDGPT